jgi:hypothetical protein
MNFKKYFYLKESPDTVFNSKGIECKFSSPDGITFGWLKAMPDIDPFFIHSKFHLMKISHYDMASSFINTFSSSQHKNNPELIKNSLKRMPFFTYPDTDDLVDFFHSNPLRWKDVCSGRIGSDYADKMTEIENLRDAGAKTDVNERNLVYNYAGRLWKSCKVISFWATIGTVPKENVYKVFEYLGVENGDEYEIDLIDPQRLDLESTPDKKLPTVEEYFSQKKGAAPKVSKEDEKKLAELMAKKHTETDPTKRKQIEKQIGMYDDNVKPWGSTLVAQKNPVWKRQAEFTSESLSFEKYFKII